MSEIDWDKAPEWATHWCPGNARIKAVWIYRVGNEFYACYADKGLEHIVDFPAWRFTRLIPRPSPAWSGEGLPPVGVVCELRCLPVGGWGKAEIKYMSETQCVWRWLREDGGYQVELAEVPDVTRMAFRPIRTPEQIAADEREVGVAEMLGLFGGTDSRDTYLMQRLYDAGYRKP